MKKEIAEFGKKIREVRLKKKMSQGDVARILGVHRTYISGLERGVRNPSLSLNDKENGRGTRRQAKGFNFVKRNLSQGRVL